MATVITPYGIPHQSPSTFRLFGPNSQLEPLHFPVYMTSVSVVERSFRLTEWKAWFNLNWTSSVYLSLVYVSLIFSIQIYMNGRKPFSLRRPLIFWNGFLAVFSILGAIRTAPELLHIFETKDPWYTSICTRDFHNVASAFWSLLFALSKAVELGDTLFIVLRKQPLIFLHWYHHITVLCYCWATFSTYDSTGMWFVVMNYTVHSLMYSYYTLRAMKVRVPRSAAMAITSLQLVQMAVGIGCNLFALHAKFEGRPCATDFNHLILALSMYLSYLVLFANFFRHAYLKKKIA